MQRKPRLVRQTNRAPLLLSPPGMPGPLRAPMREPEPPSVPELWVPQYDPDYDIVDSQGAFENLHGFTTNWCATRIQALYRGHRTRKDMPMIVLWIVKYLLE